MRRILKTLVYATAALLARRGFLFVRSPPAAIILMYHAFDDTGWKYGVRPKELERQLAYLVKHKRVVPFEDVVAFARDTQGFDSCRRLCEPQRSNPDTVSGPASSHILIPNTHTRNSDSVAITIDDVYADTYTILFPLLKKYNIHATLFLTTHLAAREKLGSLARPTWDQLREMHASGLVSVEIHGRTHVNWTEIEDDEQKCMDEILGARNDIERELGLRPRFAAYPAGRRSKKLEAYLKEQGFEGAVAITEGAVYSGDNPFALKRVQVDKTMSFLLFKLRLDAATLLIKQWLIRFTGQ